MTQSHNTPVFAKVWLSPSLFYLSNIFHQTKRVKSNLELLAMFIWWNENIDFLSKFQRHSTLTYKWSSGYSIGFFFHKKNKNTFNNESPKLLSDDACQHPCSLWGVRISAVSAVRCTCWWLSFASCCTSFLTEANGREPGLVMYCVSVKLHREGCYGLA